MPLPRFPLQRPRAAHTLSRLPSFPCKTLVLSLGLALLCSGCVFQPGRRDTPVSLQLAIGTGQAGDGVAKANLRALATQVANDYMRNHPHVLLNLRFLQETELVESMRSRAKLGAGPDLLISRVTPAEVLEREGYLRPVDISPEQLDPLRILYLSKFRDGNTYDALPFLLQPFVACFDQRRVGKVPSTINELTNQASRGMRVGLPLQVFDLLWSASDFDADQILLNLFRTRVETKALWKGLSPSEQQQLESWLAWLYQANVEPNVQFVETADELVERMEKGQLDWITCNSIAIPRLKRKFGDNLGVSELPGANDGRPARPMARMQLLSFGRDSTPDQRRAATEFALFVLNDFSQTSLVEKALGSMPVNQNVVLPVKESPDLMAMESSLKHSKVPTFREGVGFRRGKTLRGGGQDPLIQLMKQAVYGEKSPKEVTRGIEELARELFLSDLAKNPLFINRGEQH